jgi:uncharacterized membrane protein
MKMLACAMTAALVLSVGCDNKSPKGGPGADSPKTSADTFTVHAPGTATDIKQGDKQEVKLSLDRGKDFKEDVTLKFEAPKGIIVEPESKVVPASDKEVIIKVGTAPDATEGKHTVTVTGTPKSGKSVTTKFDLNVKKSEAK